MINNQIYLPNSPLDMDSSVELLLQGIPLPIFLVNSDLSLRYVNPAFEEMCGYRIDELSGQKPPYSFWPSQSSEFITLLHKPQITAEQRLINKNSTDIWVEIRATSVNRGDQLQYYIVNCTNISWQKSDEKAIQAAKSKFDTVFNAIPIPVLISSLPELKILDANDEFAKTAGLKRDEIAGLTTKVLPWADAAERDRSAEKMIKNPEIKQIEINVNSKEGNLHTVLLSTRHITINGEKCVLAASIDITDRKKAELALGESESLNASLLLNSGNPIIVTDEVGKIEYANQAFINLTGYCADEVVGSRPPYRWWLPESAAEYAVNAAKAAEDEINNLEKRLIRKSGETIWIKVNYRKIRKDGEVKHFLVNLVDITESKKDREALQRSEEEFRKIFEDSPVGMMMADAELNITRVNQSLCRMLGYPPEELLGTGALNIKLSEDAGYDRLAYKNVYEGEIPFYRNKKHLVRKEGQPIWLDYNLSAVRRPNGQFHYYLIFAYDITPQIAAEEALRNSERNFRDSMENLPLGIRIDSAQGETLYANKAFLQIHGKTSLDEYLATPIEERFTPSSYQQYLERRQQRQAGIKSPDHWELEIKARNGEIRRLAISRGEVVWNNQKEHQVIFQDITEKAHFESALRKSEEKYRTLFETMAQGVVYLDRNGQVILANPAADNMMGLTMAEVNKGALLNLKKAFIHEDGSELNIEESPGMVALTTGKTVKDEVIGIFNRSDNKYHWINFTAVPQYNQGEERPYQVYLTMSDITVLKESQALSFETEALKRVNRLKSDLLANVSHELRTPLSSIKGFIETLLEPDVTWTRERQIDFLESANREADRLTFLIRDLLDMSKLDAGKMSLDRQIVAVSDILETTHNVLAVVAKEHVLNIRVAKSLPRVYADKIRIAQVITNLVENACKFSSPGTQVELSVKKSGKGVVFRIKDHGIGMSEDTINQVFNRFFQAQEVVSGKTPGTGLGLPISKGIIESHGGQIQIQSKLNEGSLFSFVLPGEGE